MTTLWQAVLGAEPRLEAWAVRGHTDLRVARLPRSAWPIVGAAVARALTARGKSAVTLKVPWSSPVSWSCMPTTIRVRESFAPGRG